MIFRKKNVHAWAKKFDKIITWVIVGTAVASMVWLSKTKKWKKLSWKISATTWWAVKKSYGFLGKCMVWTINFFKKK